MLHGRIASLCVSDWEFHQWSDSSIFLFSPVEAQIHPVQIVAAGLQERKLSDFDGEWVYVEDRTEGRPLSDQGPPMSSTFSFRSDPGFMILVSGHGSGNRDVRVAVNGVATEIPGSIEGTFSSYRATLKNGVFAYENDFIRGPGKYYEGLILKEFQLTPEGMLVKVSIGTYPKSTALYRHPQDIPLPVPARAKATDLGWLSGNWVGKRGSNGQISMEEHWSSPKGGALLAVSRTVSSGKMTAFEFLRITEREGGLVYVAQPNGGPSTEFILTEFSSKMAVFENPRHDYPKRIAYELGENGTLTATIGFLKGGTPRKYEFKKNRLSGTIREMKECRIIRKSESFHGTQGLDYFSGISAQSAGSKALCMHMLVMPPGASAKSHYHENHETAIYMLEGTVEFVHGPQLEFCDRVSVGDYVYIPAGTPHRPYNPTDERAVAIIARTDPNEQESVVLLPE